MAKICDCEHKFDIAYCDETCGVAPAARMLVCMGAKEYYSGDVTLDLPFGLIEDDIDDVQPDGYGQFWVFLEKSGKHKLKAAMDALGIEPEVHEYRSWCRTVTHEDWNIVQMRTNGEFVLEWRGEIMMEFCEVDENIVDHWEVDK